MKVKSRMRFWKWLRDRRKRNTWRVMNMMKTMKKPTMRNNMNIQENILIVGSTAHPEVDSGCHQEDHLEEAEDGKKVVHGRGCLFSVVVVSGLMAHHDLMVHRGLMVHRDLMALQDLTVHHDLMVHIGLMVHQDLKGDQGLMDHLGLRVDPDLKDHLVKGLLCTG
jgi:hypothetical protein